jgi:hypothetical protein
MQGYTREELFELPVEFGGSEVMLPARWVQMGYTYKIFVQVNDAEVVFEPDEERNFRAIIEKDMDRNLSPELIKAIGQSLEKYFR